ncbi:MAG: 50S ribosomal protein L9 [Candidatus Brocadia sp. WS118]|nr:MAG: 50S ribosomal protein L9 [Candidatus Brocadia sp. WS118]
MELLLKKNVDKLGRIGDIVKVKEGYARNYLLPKGLATSVSPANVKQIEKEKIRMELQLKEEREKLEGILERISTASCTILAKANEEGRLFGSVAAVQIADALAKEGYPVNHEMVKLDSPIKVCGDFDVTIALSLELQTKCKVSVVKEDTGQPENN